MSVDWIWSQKESSGVSPLIGDQFVKFDATSLQIRNPWAADSAFMGKMYATGLVFGMLATIGYVSVVIYNGIKIDYGLLIALFSVLTFTALFLALRIYLIKSRSDFVFCRVSGRVYYRERGRIISGIWDSAIGGMQSTSEFTGRAVVVTHSLLLRMQAESRKIGTKTTVPVTLFVAIDSNVPSDPHVLYIAQVWEFIRLFMSSGPHNLPVPVEPCWWYTPLHRVYLTPTEAWRHYAPWRSGEPGERQGKKNWLLPMWLLLFPYTLFSALCWYGVCRVFNVNRPPLPTEEMAE